MYMSVVTHQPGVPVYAELAGSRVLITGVTAAMGVDVARAFADHKSRLILQSEDNSPEMAELGVLLSQTASEISFYCEPIPDGDAAVRLAQKAAQIHAGLDAVINLIPVTHADLSGRSSFEDIDNLVTDKLARATHITRVAANRMRLTWIEGLILNVAVMPVPANAAEATVAAILRSSLAGMTRGLAAEWADQAIRVNAIGPRGGAGEPGGACLGSEPDVAALALYLASRKGRQLSGHVFDAEGVARRVC